VTNQIAGIYNAEANYGLLVRANAAIYGRASENGSNRPVLEITYEYVPIGYALTVNSGTGGGTYTQGTVVNIAANAAPSGTTFDKWTGGVATVADPSAAATTITMPASDAEVTATYLAVVPPLLGDLNGDGFVGQGDLNIVLSQWGKGAPPHDPIADPRADANHDNFVGQGDLNIVLADWGQGTPP